MKPRSRQSFPTNTCIVIKFRPITSIEFPSRKYMFVRRLYYATQQITLETRLSKINTFISTIFSTHGPSIKIPLLSATRVNVLFLV